jgi:hypothetical protein
MAAMNLELSDEQTEALLKELNNIIDGDRYQFSALVRMLKAIRAICWRRSRSGFGARIAATRSKNRPMRPVDSTRMPGASPTTQDRRSAIVYRQTRWTSSIQVMTSAAPVRVPSKAARHISSRVGSYASRSAMGSAEIISVTGRGRYGGAST